MRNTLFILLLGMTASACSLSKHIQINGKAPFGKGRPGAVGNAAFAMAENDIVVVEAGPGLPAVGPMAPTWCDLVEISSSTTSGEIQRAMEQLVDRGWAPGSLGRIAPLLCTNPADPSTRKQTGYFVQAWINMTHQATEDAMASIHARLDTARWQAEHAQTCQALAVSNEASEEERRVADAQRVFFGCRSVNEWPEWWASHGFSPDITWHVDATASAPSETMRLYHVLRCLPRAHRALETRSYVSYGLCGQDARALDGGRLEREIAKLSNYAQVLAREALVRARVDLAHLDEAVRALAQKDAAYRGLFIDVPRAAWKAWEEDHARHQRAIAAARAFERKLFGPSRKAMRGCSQGLRQDFHAYIGQRQPRDHETFLEAATTPVGMVLLEALLACEAAEGNGFVSSRLGQLYKKGRLARGPRAAVYHAMVDALADILADRRQFPVEPGMLGHSLHSPVYEAADALAGNWVPGMSQAGEVESVTRQGDGVRLTFRTVRWQEDKYKCHPTNRIWRIHPDGRIEYHQDCKKVGKEWKSSTPPPMFVPAGLAGGIAAGSFVELDMALTELSPQGDKLAFPIAVYDSKARKKLLAAYGVKL